MIFTLIKQYLSPILIGLFVTLVTAWGIQTYRLSLAHGKIAVFEEREAAQLRDKARRDAANLRNKERTDENHVTSLKRAASVVVRRKPTRPITSEPPAPISSVTAAECLRRGDVNQLVTDFAVQHGEGLTSLIAEVSRRHAADATRVAREAEAVAASYRSCRRFTLDEE